MGKAMLPPPVKLIVAMLAGKEEYLQEALVRLEALLGATDFRSALLPFTHTDYYSQEMGEGLMRQFIAFENLIDPGELARIKRLTNQVEEEMSFEGKRCVNLDPGYIAPGKLVLATTKDRGHRIYLSEGIYAEVTLVWKRGEGFQPEEWTYPDYRTPEYRAILGEIRGLYMRKRPIR